MDWFDCRLFIIGCFTRRIITAKNDITISAGRNSSCILARNRIISLVRFQSLYYTCFCYAYIIYRHLTIKYECMLIADELRKVKGLFLRINSSLLHKEVGTAQHSNTVKCRYLEVVGTIYYKFKCFLQPWFGVGDFFKSPNYPKCKLICTSGNLDL